jgi:hypothetical protein
MICGLFTPAGDRKKPLGRFAARRADSGLRRAPAPRSQNAVLAKRKKNGKVDPAQRKGPSKDVLLSGSRSRVVETAVKCDKMTQAWAREGLYIGQAV